MMSDILAALTRFEERELGYFELPEVSAAILKKLLQLMEYAPVKFENNEIIEAYDLSVQWGFERGVVALSGALKNSTIELTPELLGFIKLYDETLYQQMMGVYCETTKKFDLTDDTFVNELLRILFSFYQKTIFSIKRLHAKATQRPGIQPMTDWITDMSNHAVEIHNVSSALFNEKQLPTVVKISKTQLVQLRYDSLHRYRTSVEKADINVLRAMQQSILDETLD